MKKKMTGIAAFMMAIVLTVTMTAFTDIRDAYAGESEELLLVVDPEGPTDGISEITSEYQEPEGILSEEDVADEAGSYTDELTDIYIEDTQGFELPEDSITDIVSEDPSEHVLADSSYDVWDGSIATSFAGGDGSEASPYLISTGAELAYFAKEAKAGNISHHKFVKLVRNIDLDNREWEPINNGRIQMYFNGDDHIIKGIYINSPKKDNQGLFGEATNLTVNNLTVDGKITGRSKVGGITGSDGTVSSCCNMAEVNGADTVGGITGYGGNVTDSVNKGKIKGGDITGGIVGSGKCSYCGNLGEVSGTEHVGGIAGYGNEIKYCYNDAAVTGTSEMIGGIAGYCSGPISYSYNTKTPKTNTYASYVGGIVGRTSQRITACFYYGNRIEAQGSNCGPIKGSGAQCYSCYYLDSSTGSASDGIQALTGYDFKDKTKFDPDFHIENWIMGRNHPQFDLEDWMFTVTPPSGEGVYDASVSFNTYIGDYFYITNNKNAYAKGMNSDDGPIRILADESRNLGEGDVVKIQKHYKSVTFTINRTVPVTGVKLNTGSESLLVGKTLTLTATVSPEDATNKNVTWNSDNESVATVKGGVVKGVSAGTAHIIVMTEDGNKTAACTITVKNVDQKITAIKFDVSSKTVKKGDSYTLKPVITPSDAKNKTLKWKSSNEKVATVSKSGKINARSPGNATITATATDGGNASASVTIKVADITFNTNKLYVKKGKTNKSVKITVKNDKIKAASASNKKISVKLKGNKLEIKGKSNGNSKITVTTKGGITSTLRVKVQAKDVVPKTIKVSSEDVKIKKGKTKTVTVTVTPDKVSTGKKIEVSSDKKSVATAKVDQATGKIKITAKKKGKCTITAKVGSKKVKIKVKVTK